MRSVSACVLSLVLVGLVQADDEQLGSTIRLPPAKGAVVLPDGRTLVVSVPSLGTLVHVDTSTGEEIRRVEVDFKPRVLAVQGENLFATTDGTSKVNVLDPTTGAIQKTINVAEAPILDMDCHPTKGLLYVTTTELDVFSVDVKRGRAQDTGVKGQVIAVDPVDGDFVYTGIQKPIADVVVVRSVGRRAVRVSFEQADVFAVLLKHRTTRNALRTVAVNDAAAVNGRDLAISSDGTRIAMTGGGGWRTRNDRRANYSVAVFDTKTMTDLVGQVTTGAYPNAVAFHPKLNYGAVYRASSREVHVFRDKSFVTKATFGVAADCSNTAGMLLFGGGGTTVTYVSRDLGSFAKESVVQTFRLPLTNDDEALLQSRADRSAD